MLGHGWQSHWARVHRRLGDVRAVYAGREGGTDDARDQDYEEYASQQRVGAVVHS